MNNAPVYGTRFASGDRDYNDLSQWWYLIQTDWSGGFKDTISFADDAQFYYSSNIDARTKPGTIQLEKQVSLVFDNTVGSNEITHMGVYNIAGNEYDLAIQSTVVDFSGNSRYTGSSTRFLHTHQGYLWQLRNSAIGYSNSTAFPVTVTSAKSYIDAVITGSIDSADVAVSVGNVLYLFGIADNETIFIVKTSVAAPTASGDFTLVAQFDENNALGANVVGAKQIGSEIIFLVEGSPVWTLYSLDIASGIVSTLYAFDNCAQNGIYDAGKRFVTPFGVNKLLITVKKDGNTDEGLGEIWSYDGTTLERIYSVDEEKKAFSTGEARAWLSGGCTVYGGYAFWGNLAYDGEHFFNFIKDVDDSTTYTFMPIGENGQVMYLANNDDTSGDDQIKAYSYNNKGTAYKDGANHEAFLVFSQHDKLQSIDKLLNSATIGFKKLLTGQSISIYYSTNPIPDPNITTGGWTLLGTASYTDDGGSVTSKVLLFPVGTIAKKVWFRAELTSGGTDTPGLTDFTLEYLPVPDYKKQWSLNVNCGDEVKTLAGNLVETTGRELKSRLERMWWAKSALDFQDLDYATTLVDDASFDATETTITVDSTKDFPEQGRFRVDDEEVLYTSKNATQFLGCTRGARGTRATTHADNAVLHNGYRVLVLGVDEQAPILLKDKLTEYVVGLSLREV